MAVTGCRSMLRVGAQHLTRVASRGRLPIGKHVAARVQAASTGIPRPNAPEVCQGTDDSFRALYRPDAEALPEPVPGPASPGFLWDMRTATLGVVAGAAIAPAVGAGAMLAYQSLFGGAETGVGLGGWPDTPQQPMLEGVAGMPLAIQGGAAGAASAATLVLPAVRTGSDVPLAVPEPSSVLVLASALLVAVLAYRVGLRRGPR